MSVESEARAHRARQATLTGYLVRELIQLWRALFGLRGPGPDDLAEALDLVRPLIVEYASASGELATDGYLAQRAAAGLRAGFVVPEVIVPRDEQIEGSLSWVLRPATDRSPDPGSTDSSSRSRGGLDPDPSADDEDTAPARGRTSTPTRRDLDDRAPIDLDALAQRRESDLKGAATRMVAQTGRTTLERAIDEDPTAVGWARITDGDPCAFCAMLAGRGFIYLSAETAKYREGTRDPYHDEDGCTVMARFRDEKSPLPAANQAAQDLWYETGAYFTGQDAYNAFRRALKAQRAGGDHRAAAFEGPASDPEKYRRLVTHDAATVEQYRRRAQRGGRNGGPLAEPDGTADPRFRT